MEEKNTVQYKNISSNKGRLRSKSTKDASTDEDYRDFENCQGLTHFTVLTCPSCLTVTEERSAVQNKNISSNEGSPTSMFTTDAPTNVDNSDFDNCQDADIKEKIERLKKILQSKNENDFSEFLEECSNTQNIDNLNKHLKEEFQGESLLHIALKFNGPFDVVKTMIKQNYQYLKEQRTNYCKGYLQGQWPYQGQTPLHIAIAKGDLQAVETITEIAKEKEISQELFGIAAVGKQFNNTVLMGQLPLSVAALACKDKDFRIITHLLLQDAKIWNQNDDGDTVFHSLIKYADIYPEKIQHIKKTFEFLWERFNGDCNKRKQSNQDCNKSKQSNEDCNESKRSLKPTDILFWKNKSGLTVLCLSAKLGVNELFDFIINIQNVYRMINIRNGLFDIREYDVTEFDRLISYKDDGETKEKITILESLFDSRCTHKEAFQILNHELVRFILQRKWVAYKTTFFIWMILHFAFMTLFTTSSILKSKHLLLCSHDSETSCDMYELFYAAVAMNTTVGVAYLTFAFLCIVSLIKRCGAGSRDAINFGLMWHNLDYIVCLLVTAIGALMESCLIVLKMHWDYHLVLTLICGWYFILYFSPFSKRLVSFTYMIKSGFLEDFVPFAVVFVGILFSFTSMMYMLFRGTHDVDEFESFESALLTMFNLGVGLNDIGVLHKSRIPWLAYTLFIVFLIISFIHLLNALVAIMSQTFSDVHRDRSSFLKYNKLKMIELFEDIILVKPVARHLPFFLKAKHWTREGEVELSLPEDGSCKQQGNKMKRFYSVLHLLDEIDGYNDDKEEKKRQSKFGMQDLTKFLYNYQHVSKKKTTNLKRSRKINPEKEIIFIQVQKNDKSSQFPG